MNDLLPLPCANIFPLFDRIIDRTDKERRLHQRAKVLWLTGLSGAGKSTLATHMEKKLFAMGFFPQVIDGDNLRAGINTNLGFSEQDRFENIRRIAEVSKLVMNCGLVTIVACISPTNRMRQMAYDIIGKHDVIEIFVDTPIEVCEARDPKGLYKRARASEIPDFTGIHSPFEKPQSPAVIINTAGVSVKQSVGQILHYILPKITL